MEKKEKLASILTAVFLFLIAALFSISEILGALSLNSSGALYRFGHMIISVYGISSICIPVFFFVASCFCLTAKWTLQKLLCLLVSAIPFLTLSLSERASRSIASSDSSPIAVVKIITLMVIAILLVMAEYLITLVIAGYVQKRGNGFKQKKVVNESEEISLDGLEEIEISEEDDENEEEDDENEEEAVNNENEEDDYDKEIDESIEKATDDSTWSLSEILKKNREKIEKNVLENDPWNVVRNSGALEEKVEVKETVAKEESDPWNVVEQSEEKQTSLPKEINLKEEETEDEESEIEERQIGSEEESSELEDVALEEEFVEDEEDDIIAQFEKENLENVELEEDFLEEDESYEENKNSIETNFEAVEDFSTDEMNEMFEESENTSIEEDEDDFINMPSEIDFEEDSTADSDLKEVESEEKKDSLEKKTESKNSVDSKKTKSSLESVFERMDEDVKANFSSSSEISSLNNTFEVSDSTENAESVEPRAVHTDLNGNTKLIDVPSPKLKRRHGAYKIPTDLLTAYSENPYWIIDAETTAAAENLKNTLKEFKIDAEVTGIKKGPVVTMFEILPAPGVKLSKIVALQDNIALRLAAQSVRIVAPIPGKHAVGIEVPNKSRAIISMRECIEQDRPEWKKMAVPVVLGKDIQGETQIIDLAKTPHLLIAGSTGAGKSVCVNSMILSILYKRSPNEVKMILIDPKIVELKLYNDIPHLLTPVITEPKRAMQSLQYCLCEMERRYALLDHLGVRDISSYNKKIVEKGVIAEKLPYLIVIIDEFADLMATTGKQLEGVLARLAAMSRAVGIHLVLATQRPSIDVITGLIKANIPSRIAFMVASKMDSRIIIDQVGAEKLLGKGDMLYASATDPFPVRIQGTFVSDQEVEDVVTEVKAWGEPEYIDDEIFVDDDDEDDGENMSLFSADGDDPLYEKALEIVVQTGKASASYIQRKLKIGYNRAARLVEEMEARGIVGPANGSKPRELIHVP